MIYRYTEDRKRKDENMANKTKRLKPDTVLKNYWRNNERFADLFNAVLFDGKQVLRPEELEDVDTEESSILENKDYAESLQASRDNLKIRKRSSEYGMEFVLLGNESQKHIHYAMPMRIMGYDYGTYKKQYDSNAQKYTKRDGLEEDEYLSKMKSTDKFVPVVSIVVYYGDKPWNGATTLHEMLNIPREMKKCVNDYKIPLVEARKNNLVLHNTNNRDLFNLLEIILDKSISRYEAKKKAIQYSEEHGTDKSVVMTIAGAANSRIDYNAFEKGEVSMCTLFDEIARESEAIGEVRGEVRGIIETGYDYKIPENDILKRLQNKLNISMKQAQEYLDMFKKQTAL